MTIAALQGSGIIAEVKFFRFLPVAVLCTASVATAESEATVVDAERPPGYGVAWSESAPAGIAPSVEKNPERHLFKLQRGGERVGLGAVLASGRALASLTSVGSGRDLVAAFADGRRLPLQVVATHRGFDLALLAFSSDKPSPGLELSNLDQPDRALLLTAKRPTSRPFVGKKGATVVGADQVSLDGATLSQKALPLGAPVVDSVGRLAGMSVQGCVVRSAAAPCLERDVVIPTTLLRQFLQGAEAGDSLAWFGAGVEFFDAGWLRGLRVVSIEVGSPAQAASLEEARPGREGDLLVAIDGVPIGTPRRLHEMVTAHVPGAEIDILLLREGTFRHVKVRLGAQRRSDDAWQLNPPLIQPPSPWPGF